MVFKRIIGRLRPGRRSVQVLEAGLGRFPEDRLLLEQYVRLCADQRQIDRAIQWFSGAAASRAAVCETLFARFPDPYVQVSLVEYCFDHGLAEIADARIESVREHCHDTACLWRLADLLLLHRRGDQAQIIYRLLAARPHENAQALLYSALAEYRLQNPDRAAKVLEHGVADYPDAADLREHFIGVCSELGQVDRVIRVLAPNRDSEVQALEQLLDTYKDPQVQANLIGYCLGAGRTELAERRIRSALQRSDSIERLWIVSDVLLHRGRTKDAEAIYRQLSARAPDSAQSAMYSGLAAYRLRNPERAAEVLEQGVVDYPKADQLREHFVHVCSELGQVDRIIRVLMPNQGSEAQALKLLFDMYKTPQIQANLIGFCLRAGLTELAEQRIRYALQRSDSVEQLWVLSDVLLHRGRTSDAEAIYKQLSTRAPDSARSALYSGLADYRLRNPERAADALERGVIDYPDSGDLREHFARVCSELGQVDRIIRVLMPNQGSKAQALEQLFDTYKDPEMKVNLIGWCMRAGLTELAMRRIRHALQRSDSIERLWMLSDVLLHQGRTKDAEAIYRQLSTRAPDSARSAMYSGLAVYRLRDPGRAADMLEHGVIDYPDSDDLREHFVRVCAELGQVDRIIRVLMPNQGSEAHALERLLDTYKDPRIQASLIGCCLRAGLTELAERAIHSTLLVSDDPEPLWILSDLLFVQGRTKDAEAIYRRLVGRAPDTPQSALYSGLAAYRLRQPQQAADLLETGLRKFRGSAQLLEHFARICIEIHAVSRVRPFVAPAAQHEAELCELLFERFGDARTQISLIEYCAKHGLAELAEQKLAKILETSSDDPPALWAASDLLAKFGRGAEATDIYKRLSGRELESAEDYYYSSLALLRLDNSSGCVDLLERGLRAYPADTNLSVLYLQVCAGRLEYSRYRNLKAGTAAPALSIADFYEEFSRRAPVEFILIFAELESQLDAVVVDGLKKNFIAFLRENPQSVQLARIIVFLSRFLDLAPEFTGEILNAVIDAHRNDGDRFKGDEHLLRIVHGLSPAMVPRRPEEHGKTLRQFIAESRALAQNPVELGDPLVELTSGWTPWQMIFCRAEPELYGEAMAAFEELAFKTWPRLNHVAPHVGRDLRPAAKGQRKIRVGVNVHDAMPMMSGLLTHLDPDLFETVFLRPGKQGTTPAAKNWVERAGKTVEFSDIDTYAAIETIERQELDIIIAGPSMGASFYPMMAKLATLHMILLEPNWTDGLTNSDYYISWQRAEPENPAVYYKTAVSFFEHPPYWIEKPDVERLGTISQEARAQTRKRLLDAGPQARVYLCANTPPKIHPEMDEIFREILERDKEAILVLLRGEYPPAKTLRNRLRESLGACYDRVVFLSTLKKDDAHMLLQSVDCCLDSYPLCGMSSSFDGAMLGVPLVTLPAKIPFSRWTAAIYEYIGVSGLTARDKQDYVDIALRLASDVAWRNEKGAELRQKSSRYVESQDSCREFERFLLEAWNRRVQGLAPANWIDGQWH